MFPASFSPTNATRSIFVAPGVPSGTPAEMMTRWQQWNTSGLLCSAFEPASGTDQFYCYRAVFETPKISLYLGDEAVLGAGWLLTRGGGAPGVDRIAVMPPVDASGQDGEFLDALHNSLTTSLTGIDGATVTNRATVMQYQDERPPDREISAELNVGAIVDAQIFRIGERARLTVQFSEALTSGLVWSGTYDLTGDDMFAVQDSLVELVTIGIGAELDARGVN